MPTWISMGKGVATRVGIRIHPTIIAFHSIRREEDAGDGVVVARVVVIEAGDGVVVLAGVAFGGVITGRACREARGAVGGVELRAEQGGAAAHAVEDGQHAAQVVRQEIVGGRGATALLQFADEPPAHRVVVRAALQIARRLCHAATVAGT